MCSDTLRFRSQLGTFGEAGFERVGRPAQEQRVTGRDAEVVTELHHYRGAPLQGHDQVAAATRALTPRASLPGQRRSIASRIGDAT